MTAAYEYTCAQCAAVFDAPGSNGYGLLVVRSEGTGHAALVDAFADDVFSEVANLAGLILPQGHFNDLQIGAAIQYAFGFACDLDPDGTRFSISEQPHCPVCGSNRMARWELTARPCTAALPQVTHAHWLTLGTDERQRIVRQAVSDFLSH